MTINLILVKVAVLKVNKSEIETTRKGESNIFFNN